MDYTKQARLEESRLTDLSSVNGLYRAVFLDRDGTLNVEVNYLHRVADLVLIPSAAQAVRTLNQAGYLVIVVTNQAGIARGYYDEAALHAFHAHFSNVLAASGAHLDAIYFCPHHPDFTGTCMCRKPAPGLLQRAAAEWCIDLQQSWLIGDNSSDIKAGCAGGCRTILVRSGYGAQVEARLSIDEAVRPDTIVDDIGAAVRYILEHSSCAC
jgi:D-glycero-D-manno-heptose 1,7-bisphosphate phosphatase